jgi:hypothetical protein
MRGEEVEARRQFHIHGKHPSLTGKGLRFDLRCIRSNFFAVIDW